jgi:hypothetical protein
MSAAPTHSVTVEVRGVYPHIHIKPHASVTTCGDGNLEHVLQTVRVFLVAAGFSPATAARVGLLDAAPGQAGQG